jgi:hypothetical protein
MTHYVATAVRQISSDPPLDPDSCQQEEQHPFPA